MRDARWRRRLLWLVFLLTLPLPYALVEPGRVPPAWLLTVSGVMVAASVVDGGSITRTMALYLSAQALFWLIACYVAARLVCAALRRWAPTLQSLLVVLAAAGCLWASTRNVYHDTTVDEGRPTNFLGMFRLR